MHGASIGHLKVPLVHHSMRIVNDLAPYAVLFTCENTDPKCYWLTNYVEVGSILVAVQYCHEISEIRWLKHSLPLPSHSWYRPGTP